MEERALWNRLDIHVIVDPVIQERIVRKVIVHAQMILVKMEERAKLCRMDSDVIADQVLQERFVTKVIA